MSTSTFIRKYIFGLPKATIFTTRDLLSLGQRAAVDQAIFRLVKSGEIVRLARGVFVRWYLGMTLPSAFEIATVKANAFVRQIVTHGDDAAAELKLIPSGNDEPTYFTDGATSSFKFGDITIRFQKVSARRMRLGDTPAGLALRALWQLGRDRINALAVWRAKARLSRDQSLILRQCIGLMPYWLSRYFINGRYDPINRLPGRDAAQRYDESTFGWSDWSMRSQRIMRGPFVLPAN